jgi:hypothetical protein
MKKIILIGGNKMKVTTLSEIRKSKAKKQFKFEHNQTAKKVELVGILNSVEAFNE